MVYWVLFLFKLTTEQAEQAEKNILIFNPLFALLALWLKILNIKSASATPQHPPHAAWLRRIFESQGKGCGCWGDGGSITSNRLKVVGRLVL